MMTNILKLVGEWNGLEFDGQRYFRWTTGNDLLHISDGYIIDGVVADIDPSNKTFVSSVPVYDNVIQLSSSFFIPKEVISSSQDGRKLGVRLYGVIVSDGSKKIAIQIGDIPVFDKIIACSKYGLNMVEECGGTMITVTLPTGQGKINLGTQYTFAHHFSGWNYVLSMLSKLNNPDGVFLDGVIENSFGWHRTQCIERSIIPYKTPWVGMVHNPPNMAMWFCEAGMHSSNILRDDLFKQSKHLCRGLFTFSKYHADYLRTLTDIPINHLYHPTKPPTTVFSFEKWEKQDRRSVATIGWWLRKMYSLHKVPLDQTKFSKICLVRGAGPNLNRVRTLETIISGVTPTAEELTSVRDLNVMNEEYESILAKSVVVLDLYDSSANNAIIECIARYTPLIINRLPAVQEYLGIDYPLYFDNITQISALINDKERLVAAHNYLKQPSIQYKVSGNAFLESFVNSSIYQSL